MSGGAYHGGGGGYHGGGGGYHGGGGGYHGGGGYYHGGGGYYHGGYSGYGRYGYGYGYPGFGLYLGLGGLGYGGLGYGGYAYPSYDYGYTPGYYYDYDQPAYGVPLNPGVQTQSAYPPSGGSAQVVIKAPPAAEVWVDDYKVAQGGPVRSLNTPPVLEPGKPYHYTIKAQWTDNGKPVVQERRVNVEAGQTSTVDFTQPGK